MALNLQQFFSLYCSVFVGQYCVFYSGLKIFVCVMSQTQHMSCPKVLNIQYVHSIVGHGSRKM